MNRWTLTAHRRRPDEGASLVLAMIFVMFVGLVVTTMLSFGSTALVSTTATAARGQADYDVDGALQAAINSIRQSRYDNALGESCLNSTTTLPYPGGRVAVTCAPRADSGAAGGPAGRGRSTMPDWALLALGTDPEEGIHQRGNNTFWVRGGKVQSNAGITVAGWACPASPQPPVAANCAQLYDSSDQVIAAQACRGGISSPASPPYVCGSGAVVADPGYSQPAVVGAGTRTVPNCSATTGATVTLHPGLYTDVTPLNALMACRDKVILFTPGVYFFDFRNGEPGGPTGDPVWQVHDPDTTIVGGTPSGWDPTSAAKPTVHMPGSCLSPMSTAAPGSGVEFVFGGDSRWRISGGNVELCGQSSSTGPPITIAGATADDGTMVATGTVGSAWGDGPSPFVAVGAPSLAAAMATGDGAVASATLSGGPASATLSTLGYVPTPGIPAGATVTSATLSLRYRVTVAAGHLATWVATVRNGFATATTALPTAASGWQTSQVDLPANLAASIAEGTYLGMNVQLDAASTRGTTATLAVDSLRLTVRYVPPTGVRSQTTGLDGRTSCTGAVPYAPGPATACAMLTTRGTQTQLFVQGTVYAPLAALDIDVPNTSAQVFHAGMIVRSLWIGLPASFHFSQPIVDVPTVGTGPPPLEVYLTAYLCPADAACAGVHPPSAPWLPRGRARVLFTDTTTPPSSGHRGVTVESWQVDR